MAYAKAKAQGPEYVCVHCPWMYVLRAMSECAGMRSRLTTLAGDLNKKLAPDLDAPSDWTGRSCKGPWKRA